MADADEDVSATRIRMERVFESIAEAMKRAAQQGIIGSLRQKLSVVGLQRHPPPNHRVLRGRKVTSLKRNRKARGEITLEHFRDH